MTRFISPKFSLVWLLLAAGLALPSIPTIAADARLEAARYYEDALKRYESKDVAGTIIQLKNALQRDGRLLSAHVLLAQAYMDNHDPAAAEAALDTAARMGVARSEIANMLALALYSQGKYQDLLEKVKVDGLPGPIQQEIQLLRVYAALKQADQPAAEIALDAARKAGAETAALQVAQGMYHLQRGENDRARAAAERALRLDPQEGGAWNLLASLDHLQGNWRKALNGYAKALSFRPNLVDARLARVGILLDQGQPQDAEADLKEIAERHPDDPRGTFLLAQVRSRLGDKKGADGALLKTAKLIDSLPPERIARHGQLLMLGALAHYGMQSYERAKNYLDAYIRAFPNQPGARKLLGAIYLGQGNPNDAVKVLAQAYREAPGDPKIATLLAAGYMALDQPARAADLLGQVGGAEAKDPETVAALGFSLVSSGQRDEGMEYLGRAYTQRPGDIRLGNALVMLNIRRGESRAAVTVAETLARRHAKNASVLNLLAVARAAAGDLRGARKAYGQALALAPNFTAARLNLGKLEIAEGRLDAARQQFGQVLKTDKHNAAAQFELARTEEAAGRLAEAIRWLELVRARDAKNVQAALYLVELYLRDNQPQKALDVAKQVNLVQPDDFQSMSALGRAYAAAGQTRLAKVVFSRMGKAASFDVAMLTTTARLQLAVGDMEGAMFCLNKALSDQADDPEANVLMAQLEVERRQTDKALARLRGLVSIQPRSALVQSALGDAALAARLPAEAIRAYKAALALDDSAANALRLYQAQAATGELAAGIKTLDGWHRKHPDNAGVMLALAEARMRTGQRTQARTDYEAYLAQHGDHPMALNNLAGLYMGQDDTKALAYAERAYKHAPEVYAVNDTLGWLLLSQGQVDRALRHLRDARLRAPDNPEIRYHLAAALHRVGRDAEARVELAEALKGGDGFPGSEAARRLQKQIGGH